MKIELRNCITGKVIFTHECENNTIKKTVEEAVKQGVSLAWANLSNADLTGANLSGANLFRAELTGADLSGGKLAGADLSWADLRNANLAYACLFGAILRGVIISEDQKESILKAIGLVFHERKEEK